MTAIYLTASNWDQTIKGGSPAKVDWLLQRSTDDETARVVAARVELVGIGFAPASFHQMARLQESLAKKDVENRIAELGLVETSEVPEWATEIFATNAKVVDDLASRIAAIVELWSGESSFHKDDEMSDGTGVRQLLSSIVNDPAKCMLGDRYEQVVDALVEIGSTWGNGFDMASADDFVTDDETIGMIFEEFLDSQLEEQVAFGA